MALVLDGDSGIVGVLATNADGDVIIDTNTFFVDAPNNSVGIGTLTPTRKLHVNGSGRFDMAAGTVRISEQQSMVSVQGVNNAENAFTDLKIDGSNVILNVQSGGNVGIGDSTPTEGKLVVRGDANTNGLFVGGNSTTGQSYGALINAGTNSSDANFRLYDQSGSTPYLFVRGDGNVGIGTDSPASLLDVDKSQNS